MVSDGVHPADERYGGAEIGGGELGAMVRVLHGKGGDGGGCRKLTGRKAGNKSNVLPGPSTVEGPELSSHSGDWLKLRFLALQVGAFSAFLRVYPLKPPITHLYGQPQEEAPSPDEQAQA